MTQLASKLKTATCFYFLYGMALCLLTQCSTAPVLAQVQDGGQRIPKTDTLAVNKPHIEIEVSKDTTTSEVTIVSNRDTISRFYSPNFVFRGRTGSEVLRLDI